MSDLDDLGDLDLSILDDVDVGDLQLTGGQLHREYLSAAFIFIKSGLLYALNNDGLRQACERVSKVANDVRAQGDGVASMEFLSDGVCVNRELLRVNAKAYEQAEYLSAVWSGLGVGQISVVDDTTAADWIELIRVFKESVTLGESGEALCAHTVTASIRLVVLDGYSTSGVEVSVSDKFRALRAYALTSVALSDLIETARDGARLRVNYVKRPLQEIIALSEEGNAMLLALTHMKRHKQGVHHHLANTAVIAVCASRPLGLGRAEACELAMAAAVHDLGRAFISEQTFDGLPQLLEQPRNARDMHVSSAGEDLATEHRAGLETICKLVRTSAVNERTMGRLVVANEAFRASQTAASGDDDAGGYAFGHSATAKIVAVAHAYDLLTTPSADHPALLPDEALRVIVAESGRQYDEIAVKLLVNALGVYPVGSMVALSNGESAIVIEAPRANAGPSKPRVKTVRSSGGEVMDGAIIDLAGEAGGSLRILHCLDAEEEAVNVPAFLLS